MEISYLKAFSDNYIWLLQESDNIVVIDPGQSEQVINYITTNKLNLAAILLTHAHNDHLGGVKGLLSFNNNFPIYGKYDFANSEVIAKYQVNFNLLNGRLLVEVLNTPGHTWDSVCFLIKDNKTDSSHLFCGDTLFGAGCGRVFTGDYQAMFTSLNKISNLPLDTLIYPAHEYTLKNLEFALFIEATNKDILDRINIEKEKLYNKGITLPTTLRIELKTNPFLRCMDLNIVHCVSNIINRDIKPGLDCFIKLRELRNDF